MKHYHPFGLTDFAFWNNDARIPNDKKVARWDSPPEKNMKRIEIKKYTTKFQKEEDEVTDSEFNRSESLDSGPANEGYVSD